MWCPYSEAALAYWDGVCNPMGEACNDCQDYDCEHNPNPDPMSYFEPEIVGEDLVELGIEEE